VELLVVATVAGVLATLVVPTGLTFWRSWKERQLRRSLVQIRAAIDDYHADWEHGCIESESEKGWPKSLEELTEEKELQDAPTCELTQQSGGNMPQDARDPDAKPPTKQYLRRIPADPFNDEGEERDVSGWLARSYDDEFDSDSWGGDDVYDVRSSSRLTGLDGTKYGDW
jgi:general secretion pathway protein G